MDRSRSAGTRGRARATVAAIAGMLLLGGLVAQGAAEASPAAPPPGNRGTVKVHRSTTPDADRRNEPKVCSFRVVGFGFPDDTHLELSIVGHGGPNAGTGTFEGTVEAADLSPAGDFAIAGPALPDGMYKLSADNTTAPGGAKHKVFKVDCSGEAGGTTGGDTGGTTDGSDVGATTTGGDTGGTTDGSDVGATTTGGDTTGGTAGGDTGGATTGGVLGRMVERTTPDAQVAGAVVTAADELPRTGSDLSWLILLGGGLLVGGTVLLVARRARSVRI